MVDSINDKRFDSWEEYYEKRGEETTGLVRHLELADLDSLDDLPLAYAKKPATFKENVAESEFGNFILIPAGNNQVKCIHSCFVFGELGGPTNVIGILGSRRSSPFKTLNVDHAVKTFIEPRSTRFSEGEEVWVPTMEEFMECQNAEEFKNLTSFEEESPAVDLWNRAQTFWVHPKVFKLLDANNSQRAGQLAIEIMIALDTGALEDVSPERAHYLMLFLWAVENLRATKVSITDAPTSELFDNRAQEVTKLLDPERSKSRETSERRSPSPDSGNERGRKKRYQENKQDQSIGKRRKGHEQRSKRTNRSRGKGSPSSGSSSRSKSSSSSASRRTRPKDRSRSRSVSRSKSRSPSRSRSRSVSWSKSRSESRSKSRSRSSKSIARTSRKRSRSRSRSRSKTPTRNKSRRYPNDRKKRRRDDDSDDDDRLNSVMIKNLTAITASHLKRDAKEDRKKSMLSRLAPEAAKLFDLLSARNWNDSEPRMNPFVKDLISDKDPQRASGIMLTRTKKWSGEISDKGLLAFFANGFAASDIQESPGGFTIFMFRPITAHIPSNRKDRRLQVKAMFGSTELDDEAVRYYSESDFFLPETLSDLEEQIYTCIKTLELFTYREGVAVEGYIHGLSMIQRDRRLFKNFLAADRLFAVKFAYLLDRVFQNFVDRLGDFYQDQKPIRRARRLLENTQKKAIERAMIGYEVSAIPRLFLPTSLRVEATDNNHQQEPGEGGGKHKAKQTPDKADRPMAPGWWTKNPNVVQAWRLPEGKTYPDYFDTRVPEKKVNTTDWPKFPHHKNPSKLKGLCLKYQSKGLCSPTCYMSHIDPAKMDTDTKKAIADRFKVIYA
jgi:hypothetical protein